MSMENTDTALAKILDSFRELSTQMKPDVFESISKVASLGAQSDLRTALIWMIACLIVLVFFTILMVVFTKDKSHEAREAIPVCGWFIAFSLIGFVVSFIYYTNPLNQGLANDPKLALAYEVFKKIQ